MGTREVECDMNDHTSTQSPDPSAGPFVSELLARAEESRRHAYECAFSAAPGQANDRDQFAGVRMGTVFDLAQQYIAMPPNEIDQLLDSRIHEVRVGAVSIMDKQARRKRTSDDRRRDLFELYLRRTDAIDNWDLVDLGSPYVVGGYLFDKPRAVLYELAASDDVWQRRTAIVSTFYFIRQSDLDDTFGIAEVLADDPHDLVQKAVGGWLREAGKRDRARLLAFLDRHAATMPRTALRYAIEHLDRGDRDRYLGLRKESAARAVS
jgi:3-methyladenine DNA glycosylase AlkD